MGTLYPGAGYFGQYDLPIPAIAIIGQLNSDWIVRCVSDDAVMACVADDLVLVVPPDRVTTIRTPDDVVVRIPNDGSRTVM